MAQEALKIKTYRIKLIMVLFVCMVIMGLDRSSVSVAAPIMMEELGIAPSQMGLLLSAFFWTYTLCNIPAGRLADRFGAKKVLGGAAAIWSIASALTGCMSNLIGLMAARMGVGVGEAGVFPTMAKIAAEQFPGRERATATGCYLAGARLGYALTPVVIGFLIAQFNWRLAFIITGVGSLLFCIFWFFWYDEQKGRVFAKSVDAEIELEKQTVPWLKLLTNRNILGLFVAKFGANYLYFMFLTWIPSYLVMERGFSILEMGFYASLPFVVAFITQPLTGFISDFIIRRGFSKTLARKGVLVIAQALSATIIAVAFVDDPMIAILILTVNIAAASTIGGMMQTMASEISPFGMAATVTGAMNTVGAIAGVLAPTLTGIIVEMTGSFQMALLVAGGLIVLAAVIILFVIQKIEPIRLN
jgi:MFS family permease